MNYKETALFLNGIKPQKPKVHRSIPDPECYTGAGKDATKDICWNADGGADKSIVNLTKSEKYTCYKKRKILIFRKSIHIH